jgi:hypothetical protein
MIPNASIQYGNDSNLFFLYSIILNLCVRKMRIPILYHIDESDEIMHGVGAKLSSHTVGSKVILQII